MGGAFGSMMYTMHRTSERSSFLRHAVYLYARRDAPPGASEIAAFGTGLPRRRKPLGAILRKPILNSQYTRCLAGAIRESPLPLLFTFLCALFTIH